MESVKMNEGSGKRLYEICKPYMNFLETGMDYFDFVEDVGIRMAILDQYFNGERDLGGEDLEKFAITCRMGTVELKWRLKWAADDHEEKTQKAREFKEEMERRKREWALRRERAAFLAARAADIVDVLKDYGVEYILNSEDYPVEDYYQLKFIMRFLVNKEFLPNLEALLETCTDEDLVYKDSNALMWAADSYMTYKQLLMLKGRKEFISRYIGKKDRLGRTALHRYADNYNDQDSAGIDLLVEWGADVNAKDDSLWTPLHYAASLQNDRRAYRLLKHGAEQSRNDEGMTPDDIRSGRGASDAW